MASLGKQVGTYLRGRTAEAFEELREARGTTVYKMLTEAVEDLLIKEGYLEPRKPKQSFKFLPSQVLAEKRALEREAQAEPVSPQQQRRELRRRRRLERGNGE